MQQKYIKTNDVLIYTSNYAAAYLLQPEADIVTKNKESWKRREYT